MKFSKKGLKQFLISTLIFLVFFFALSQFKHTRANEPFLRPPGAVDEEAFLEGCIRCGICIDVCRNRQAGVLKAMNFFNGFRNIGLPYFDSPNSYCERCMECNLVCPTGVLQKAFEDKLGIGTAHVDHEKYLSLLGTDCENCFELCELGAITEGEEVVGPDGRMVKLPVIDEELCDGCGVCAFHCSAFEIRYDPEKRNSGR